jgi:serpin B
MDTSPNRLSRGAAIRRSLLATGGLSVALASLGRPWATPAGPPPARAGTPPGATEPLAAAQLEFGFRLFAQVCARNPGHNTFLSPLSVFSALAMVYNGARRGTQQAMAATLALHGLRTADLNRAHALLQSGLARRDPHVEVRLADSLWVADHLRLVPTFQQVLRRYYGAGATALDFGAPAAPAVINAWVRRATHGLIPVMVENIPADALAYLINVLYFRGSWTVPFLPSEATRPHAFTLQDGTQKQLPMMVREGRAAYHRDGGLEAIALPYGSGAFRMYVLLPARTSSLREMQAGLTAARWGGLVAALADGEGTLALPRFTAAYGGNLIPVLRALGMGVVFSGRADLTGMIEGGGAAISEVRHKALLEVNERGTTGAAATEVGIATAAYPVAFTMVVDRPFLCAVRDEATGILLFLGAILDPV